MTCPVCGTPYPCVHARTSTAVQTGAEALSSPALEARNRADREHWRQEVVSRVRQHRARRRRFDANASLELDFPADAALTIASAVADAPPAEAAEPEDETILNVPPTVSPAIARPQLPKIIRFPRPAAPELDAVELAEPAPETPRILDAPEAEQMELLPSFADIRLEEAPPQNLTAELDLPRQPASLRRRFSSGVVDGVIVLAALAIFTGLFAAALSKLAEAAPQPRPALLCAAAAGAMLWLLFQYLFLVYGRRTPGMSAVGLDLLTFDGRQPSVFARCSRALAATLSGVSLGLGFAWALVDEHTLGWHDRISQTYLKSSH